MSLNALLFKNNLRLNCGTLHLNGTAPGDIKIAPFNVSSNITCANLNAEIWNGKWINGSCQVGDMLVCSNAITQTFELLPIGIDGSVLTANSLSDLGVSWI